MAIDTGTIQSGDQSREAKLIQEQSAARKRRARRTGMMQSFLWHIVLTATSLLLLLPLLFMISTSLKETGKALVYPIEWIPDPIVWRNYIDSMIQPGLPFPIFFKNTIYVTILIMAGDVLTCSMAAFAFGRLRFPYRDKLFILVISTMMLPYAATMVPTFLLFNELGWVDTLHPLWIRHWFAGSAFNVFLFRQFFRGIPYELDEAARIDGAGNWRIWLQIIMPLSQPVIATVAIFSFILGWTDFLNPVIYINSMEKRTIALGLYAYVGTYASSWNYLMAATTITTLPIVAVFLFFQRYFIRGISMTGIAGR